MPTFQPQPGSPKLPVMVFIHGGAFLAGSSNSQMYGPEFYMAEENVILVTFNYRLGIFGKLTFNFLSLLHRHIHTCKYIKYNYN